MQKLASQYQAENEKARSYAGLEVISCHLVPDYAGCGITPTR